MTTWVSRTRKVNHSGFNYDGFFDLYMEICGSPMSDSVLWISLTDPPEYLYKHKCHVRIASDLLVFVLQRGYASEYFLWYDQKVNGSLRVDIMERQGLQRVSSNFWIHIKTFTISRTIYYMKSYVRSRRGPQNWFRGQGAFNNAKFLLLEKFCWLSKIGEF